MAVEHIFQKVNADWSIGIVQTGDAEQKFTCTGLNGWRRRMYACLFVDQAPQLCECMEMRLIEARLTEVPDTIDKDGLQADRLDQTAQKEMPLNRTEQGQIVLTKGKVKTARSGRRNVRVTCATRKLR